MKQDNTELLSNIIESTIKNYIKLGGKRNQKSLSSFLQKGLKLIELSCVDPQWQEHSLITKHLFILFNAFIDDVVDTRKNIPLAIQMLNVPFSSEQKSLNELNFSEYQWLQAYEELWFILNMLFRLLPGYERFSDMLNFDIRQFLNGIRYTVLLSKHPYIINSHEHELYISNNMNIIIFATIDLLASPNVDMSELRIMREIFWHAQYMARISNDIVTWEREANDADFSSSVFALAIAERCINVRDLILLRENKLTQIKDQIKQSDILKKLIVEWQRRREHILSFASQCQSIDIPLYVKGLEQLDKLHLESKSIL
jgi:hypothetical protein